MRRRKETYDEWRMRHRYFHTPHPPQEAMTRGSTRMLVKLRRAGVPHGELGMIFGLTPQQAGRLFKRSK